MCKDYMHFGGIAHSAVLVCWLYRALGGVARTHVILSSLSDWSKYQDNKSTIDLCLVFRSAPETLFLFQAYFQKKYEAS